MPFRLSLAVAVVCALTALPLPATASAKSSDVTVMTRNLYLGSDIINLATAPDIPTLAQAAKAYFQTVEANKPEVRMKAIAAEIKKVKPDVVGLQEASRWNRGPNGVQDNNIDVLNANQVLIDYLKLLTDDLKADGLTYTVAKATTEMDIEGPHADGYDVRLTMRDAIIVKKGIKVRARRGGNFKDKFSVDTKIGKANVTRGYEAVDLQKGKTRFSVANLHAEAYSPDIAESQVKEFVKKALPSKRYPAFVTGDINSDPGSVGTSDERGTERLPKAYKAMIAGGFFNQLPRRITSGYGEVLTKNDPSKLDEWLDHIFTRGDIKLRRSSMVGTKMVGGVWPSDHRGIVATFRIG
jgi:endonuclease/exonuclease/phosphatase family metal-dependent hydrolase